MDKSQCIDEVKAYTGNRVQFAITDSDGILRGKTISTDKFISMIESGTGFCDVVFGWDADDAVYDNATVTGWHTGYPDALATLDPETYRQIPWDGDCPFFLADFSSAEKGISGVCPRTLLKNVIQRAADMGFVSRFGAEYEWFNFSETPASLQEKSFRNLRPLNNGMFGYSRLRSSLDSGYLNDLYAHLRAFDVPIEGLHGETGDGIYEASIRHSEALPAADRAVLFKTGVKEIAYRHGIIASFMAKYRDALPGCGGHIHQSLWNEEGDENLFNDTGTKDGISSLMEHYIAGQLHCLPHILPMYAPTVNSYKRFVDGSWASTTVSWGRDNRTAALRIINPNEKGARLETRVPGADANPYLAVAASLASGLYGIREELTLDLGPTTGNEYENKQARRLPSSLKEATDAMKSSTLAEELFGSAFANHLVQTREWEWAKFMEGVTDWEIKRYLEII